MARRRDQIAPALSASVVNLLLLGWTAPRSPDDNPFEVFEYSDADLERLWHAHRDDLQAEWARRGGVGAPWAATQFDKEHTTHD